MNVLGDIEHKHSGEHFREGCPACVAEENDLVPGALAQRFKDERNIACDQLRGAVEERDKLAEQLEHLAAEDTRLRAWLAEHRPGWLSAYVDYREGGR